MKNVKDYLQERKQFLQLKKDWDVVLEPQVPVSNRRVSPFAGNWGVDYLGNRQVQDKIKEQLQRKVVFIIHDTAGQFDHKDLKAFAWNEKCWNVTTDSAADAHGHGHHCAGIIGASNPATPIGAAQVLVDNGYARGIGGKCLGDQGQGSYTWIASSFLRGAEVGEELSRQGYAVVHSVSLGGGGYSDMVAKSVQQIIDAGQFIAIAAGNTYKEGLQHPANVEGVISVGSHDNQGKRSSFSTYGEQLFIAAPGQAIYSTLPGDKYASWSGTSMATPHTAAQIGIMAAIYPELTHQDEVRDFMAQFATDLMDSKRDKFTGWGSPKIAPYLNQEIEDQPEEEQPDETPEQPQDPAQDPVKSYVQTIRLSVAFANYAFQRRGDYPTKFKLSGQIEIQHRTKRFLDVAGPELERDAQQWLSRSSMVLGDRHDRNDAATYLAYFLEMQLYRLYGHRIEVRSITARDEQGLSFSVQPKTHYKANPATEIYDVKGHTVVYQHEGVQLFVI